MIEIDLIIIGGGPAGMAAAVEAKRNGVESLLILERDVRLGGILNQCIHNGFGLHKFGEELTGPEYADRYFKLVTELGIPYQTSVMVLDISRDKVVTAMSSACGIVEFKAKAIILAMGCRERTRGAINIAGVRCSGIYTAGLAQKFVNCYGYKTGTKVVILGSGDIGLIMARRMTLEGAKVEAVCEVMPFSSGLSRNIAQCLNDFDIPLYLSTTIVAVHGDERVTGVTIAQVDSERKPILATQRYIECDTVLLSVGLIPENELTEKAGIKLDRVTCGAVVDNDRMTELDGVFACGNVLHVHDLVDFVSEEAEIAGRGASAYINGEKTNKETEIPLVAKGLIRYTVPQLIKKDTINAIKVYYRVANIVKNGIINVYANGKTLLTKKIAKAIPSEMGYFALPKIALDKPSEIVVEMSAGEN